VVLCDWEGQRGRVGLQLTHCACGLIAYDTRMNYSPASTLVSSVGVQVDLNKYFIQFNGTTFTFLPAAL